MTAMTDHGGIPQFSMGLRLELARRDAGFTQRTLADELGISHRTVQDFEADSRPPKRQTMIAWAQVTGVSLTWLETGSAANPEGGGTVTDLLPRLDSNQQPAGYQQLQVAA